MAITSDGTQAFGLNTTTIDGFVVESFSTSFTSNRVDLDDSNGEPLGSTTIPGRVEFSATVQVGSGNTTPTIGGEITYDSSTFIVTEVSVEETQADYQRLSLSGYEKLNA
jgi:hypothetical protein|tara:strand:- start:1058 stop:1387 length:330 start_codon:yes stop_codon:yes gene_type:complete